jgi:hypothetical protein
MQPTATGIKMLIILVFWEMVHQYELLNLRIGPAYSVTEKSCLACLF